MARIFGIICAVVTALSTTAAYTPSYLYKFDAASAAGVDGSIEVQYAAEDSTVATIKANLDFSDWSSTLTSDSFAQCSKAATDNHYDPLRACGPASEHIAEAGCNEKSLHYACNPTNYIADPLWTDEHYPLPSENTDTWSIVLHAVCT
ncbi:uncharacterized protein PITG_01200 [Phytophthora infestans T30-4]|uniref:Uncharacterized protein n=1 Tax=Phytophthora infestans (strain T30-4) TaxID=403677 RepID=D0MUW3_PHYIT|nr:uncharacterized protein PITG_01200 [Phytophthora infestans T30-4]EEY60959.1 conserved hypothetical protein [Phytophthora infestans T30-4]|eukprot:XP_002907876.1 conserved hypothetical protein [Phytophthora infestans T30-4]